MTINIPLFENYFLLSDSHQFILAKKNEDKMFHTKKLMRCGAELNFVSEFLKFFSGTTRRKMEEQKCDLCPGYIVFDAEKKVFYCDRCGVVYE